MRAAQLLPPKPVESPPSAPPQARESTTPHETMTMGDTATPPSHSAVDTTVMDAVLTASQDSDAIRCMADKPMSPPSISAHHKGEDGSSSLRRSTIASSKKGSARNEGRVSLRLALISQLEGAFREADGDKYERLRQNFNDIRHLAGPLKNHSQFQWESTLRQPLESSPSHYMGKVVQC